MLEFHLFIILLANIFEVFLYKWQVNPKFFFVFVEISNFSNFMTLEKWIN